MGVLEEILPGVYTTTLSQIHTDNGAVYHGIKRSDSTYSGFGEAYFSFVDFGKFKGWKKHSRMTLNLIVPVGCVGVYIHSETLAITKYVEIGPTNYKRITVAPGYWVCFTGKNKGQNVVLNFANIAHDPNESVNKALDEIPLCGY